MGEAPVMALHGYWRSGAAYRVRIALALKAVPYRHIPHDLRTGAQGAADYAALNPQRMVPALAIDGAAGGSVLTQSTAIMEWLEDRYPAPPLLPADADGRAIVRAMVATIAADIHPLHNLRVTAALHDDFGADEAAVRRWIGRWMADGFAALDIAVARYGDGFAYGATPTLADCCLVPQVYSARRFGIDLAASSPLPIMPQRCRRWRPRIRCASPTPSRMTSQVAARFLYIGA